jgi:hypothetical protein
MSYERITRHQLEGWLNRSPFAWSRDARTAGVYLVHVSDCVAIKLSSTIGCTDDAVGRGRASMNLSLVSRSTGSCLNRKARDRKHFQRTSGWQGTWADGLLYWRGVFLKCPAFYDRIALDTDRNYPLGGSVRGRHPYKRRR